MNVRLSELTTLGVGGRVAHYVPVKSHSVLVAKAKAAFSSDEPWMVLGGGSNLVVSDEGFAGTVLHIQTRGRSLKDQGDGSVLLAVQAGEDWDGLVFYCVNQGLAGLESLSGVPGSVGASVVQNIGAYGHEIKEVLESIEFLDAGSGEIRVLSAGDLRLGHRESALKSGELAGIVMSVTFRLRRDHLSLPVLYAELAQKLSVDQGARVPLPQLREAVLDLRRSKGMVVDPADPDSRSVGSFFLNPIVSERFSHQLPADAPRWFLSDPADRVFPLGDLPPTLSGPSEPVEEPMVKLSAAWLIEHSGIPKGFSLPGSRVRVSGKHTLAITNPGGGSAAEVAELARYIRTQVANKYGVVLQPEPTLIGLELG